MPLKLIHVGFGAMLTDGKTPRRFAIEEVAVTYTIGTASGAGQRAGELLVSNLG